MEHNIVSVSGGKDSTALLLLALERQPDNLQAVFADTGNEHQITYDYVQYLNDKVFPIRTVKADFTRQIAGKKEYILTKWFAKMTAPVKFISGYESEKDGDGSDVPIYDYRDGMPPEQAQEAIDRAAAAMVPTGNPFLDMCIWKGRFPSSQVPFCSGFLKRDQINREVQQPLLDAGEDVISWQGVRRDESLRRSLLSENELKKCFDNGAELWIYRPILEWTAEDCFAMHRKHGIKHNPLYEMGMGRVGCMPCINCRKDELLEISKRFPEEIDRIRQWELTVANASKRVSATFFSIDGDNETAYERGNVDQAVKWAQTGRGGHTFDMFRMQNDGPVCTSIYGLCE